MGLSPVLQTHPDGDDAMTETNLISPRADRSARRIVRHYVEMVVVMSLGMFASAASPTTT
jgi:hypothetical protein